jgi:integrase
MARSKRPTPKRHTITADGTERTVIDNKRANGTGSIYAEERPDGRYRWRATYVDATGKRRTVTAATRRDVETRLADKLAEAATKPPAPTTVADITERWLTTVAPLRVRAATLDSYTKFVGYLTADLGTLRAADLDHSTASAWQANLSTRLAPHTVANARQVARQVFAEAVAAGLVDRNPFDSVKAPKAGPRRTARILSTDEVARLVQASANFTNGAAVALLFLQGWRVSEVLGLAWSDLDLDNGTARISRASTYTTSRGMHLAPPKTVGTGGVHHLAPSSISALRAHRDAQDARRADAGDLWATNLYDGRTLDLVFTTEAGALLHRQAVTKAVQRAAVAAGIDPEGIATHTGRRTVVTALYADGRVDLSDIARHVGHSNTSTTAGYVRSLGERPRDTARLAADLLDPLSGADK